MFQVSDGLASARDFFFFYILKTYEIMRATQGRYFEFDFKSISF